MKRLLLLDYCEEQLFLAIEVGIQSAPGITGILGNLLRHRAAKPVKQKVLAPFGDQYGTSLRSALFARKPFPRFCAAHRHQIPTPLDRHNDNSSIVPKTRMLLPRKSESELRYTILNAMNTLHPDTKIAYPAGGLTWTAGPRKDSLESALQGHHAGPRAPKTI